MVLIIGPWGKAKTVLTPVLLLGTVNDFMAQSIFFMSFRLNVHSEWVIEWMSSDLSKWLSYEVSDRMIQWVFNLLSEWGND